jgi:hypothetical protein
MIERSPYVAAGLTSLLLVILWDAGRDALGQGGHRSWLNWIVIGFIAYGAGVSLVFAPRYFTSAGSHGQRSQVALLLWAFAVAPFLIGFGALAAGADQWAATAALVVSIGLLFGAARQIARCRG